MDPPSKSARKREADRITQLGKTISALGEPDILKLGLQSDVLQAVMALRRITAHGARKRQMLFLGKLLRNQDLRPLEEQIYRLQQSAKIATRQVHAAETWRDRLLDNGNDALSDFIRLYPDCDRQRIRQLVRKSKLDRERNKPPQAARELFKLLRDNLL